MLDKIKKIFNKPKKEEFVGEYIKSKVIYNTENNVMILISFSKEYYYDIIEFCSACTCSYIKTKTLQSSYDEVIDSDITLTHYQRYLLISSKPEYFSNLYANCSLSNKVLEIIKDDLYDSLKVYYLDMYNLFDYNIFDKTKFKKDIEYDEVLFNADKTYSIDNIKLILSRIPDVFTIVDILDLINMYNIYNKSNIPIKLAYDAIQPYKQNAIEFMKIVAPNISEEMLDMIMRSPLFAISLDNDDLNGEMSDNDIDELFKEKYDTFIGIKDEDIEFDELIDEIINNQEEE